MTDMTPHATYLDGLLLGQLRFQRCSDCAAAVFSPRVVCPHCGSDALEGEISAGLGTVYTTTAVSQRDQPSWCVALVDLDEGFRMMGTVVGAPADEVRIDSRVSATFEQAPDDSGVRVVFALVDHDV